jgi:hypothetical protein
MGNMEDCAVKLELRIAIYIDSGVPAGPRLWKAPGDCPIKFNFPASKEGMQEGKQHLHQLQKHIDTWHHAKK